ncbi:MAG: tol-pal system protein YbgF [Hyphomicrobiales bacterium]|nr:MAG: tol-pal system protein YbgF [Hyphomicrobiales bacterium]
MVLMIRTRQTMIAALAAGAVATAFVSTASADNARVIFGNQSGGSRETAAQSLRIDTLEAQMRQLNGQVEELNHRLMQLQDQIRRMQEDTEYRLQELEGSGGRKRSQAPSRPSAPATADASGSANSFSAGTAPPQLLGTVSANDLPADQQDQIGAVIGAPLDLSALAGGRQSFGGDTLGGNPVPGVGSGDAIGGVIDSGPTDLTGGQQIARVDPQNPRDAYDVAYGYVLRGEYGQAETGFRDFLASYPSDALVPSARYWLGETLFSRQRYQEASREFLALYNTYPQSEKAPDALLKLGQSLASLGETGTACATYSEMLRKYPNASRAVRARAQSEQRKSGC